MLVNFTKMHGLGNDFVVIDAISQQVKLYSEHIKKIADRNLGIGCDQVLLVEPPIRPEADFYYRIYNADGSEVEQCGNGARCVARFVLDIGLINKPQMLVDCLGGQITLTIREDNLVNVDFGPITVTATKHLTNNPSLPTEIYSCAIGNHHGICVVEDLAAIEVVKTARQLAELAPFNNNANITFMQILDRHRIKVKTYERGAGLTLACGTGACAAVVVGEQLGLIRNPVTAHFTYGELKISFDKPTSKLQMCGPAVSVFVGRFRV